MTEAFGDRAQGLVIAVSGPPGSGKTTLTRAITSRCDRAVRVDWDGYETFTAKPPAEICQWLEAGAPADVIEVPGLADRLATLRQSRVVLFETPFGRTHSETAAHIDVSVWLDLPSDLALARKLTALLSIDPGAAWVRGYLETYTGFVHQLLSIQRSRLRPAADICLDATAPEANLTAAAVSELDRRLGNNWTN